MLARRHAQHIANSPPGLHGLVKVSSNRRSRAFTANLTRVRAGGGTRQRKHCRVIKIHKQNVALLKQRRALISTRSRVGVKLTRLGRGFVKSYIRTAGLCGVLVQRFMGGRMRKWLLIRLEQRQRSVQQHAQRSLQRKCAHLFLVK